MAHHASTIGVAGLALAAALGCQTGSTAEPREVQRTVASDESEAALIALRFDEPATAGALRLALLDLADSRCPEGVTCVWQGEAVASVEATPEDGEPTTIRLTLRPGTDPAGRAVAGHHLRLLSVEPYPRDGVSTERADVVVTVEVRRGGSAESTPRTG